MHSLKEKYDSHILDTLRYNLGEKIMQALEDPAVIEIMLNSDGQLWIDSLGKDMEQVGELSEADARGILGLIASLLGVTVDKDSPVVEGELPLDGSRFEGLFPPVVARPSFTIRKKALKIFTLADYVENNIITPAVHELICQSIVDHKNILVVGGTGSGKTTLTNAILAEISSLCPDDRLVIIEDTNELQCQTRNKVILHTTQTTSMQQLLKATMRLRPDRIVVGEVRGGEALDLLKAWNTGHPGGCSTVHANSAYGGLIRLEQLIAEVSTSPMHALIAEAVNLILFIQRTAQGRKVTEVAEVNEYDFGSNRYTLTHFTDEEKEDE